MTDDPNDFHPTNAADQSPVGDNDAPVPEPTVTDGEFLLGNDIPLEPSPLVVMGADEVISGGTVGDYALFAPEDDAPGDVPNPFDDLNVPAANLTTDDPAAVPDPVPLVADDFRGGETPSPDPTPESSADPYASGDPVTYEQAIREIDRLAAQETPTPFDDLPGTPPLEAGPVPGGITFEQAMAELDRMEGSLHPNQGDGGSPVPAEVPVESARDAVEPVTPADPYAQAAPMTYEQAMTEIDRLAANPSSVPASDAPMLASAVVPAPLSTTAPAEVFDDQTNAELSRLESSVHAGLGNGAEREVPTSSPGNSGSVNVPSEASMVAGPGTKDQPSAAVSNGDPAAPTAGTHEDPTSPEVVPDLAPATDPTTDTPTADASEYVTHLRELDGNQLVDEAFNLDDVVLREAAMAELKARLQAAGTPPVAFNAGPSNLA